MSEDEFVRDADTKEWLAARVRCLEQCLERKRLLLDANAMDAVVLEQALETYARHLLTCPKSSLSDRLPCRCGLDALFKHLRDGPGPGPGVLGDFPGCGLAPDPDFPGKYLDPHDRPSPPPA